MNGPEDKYGWLSDESPQSNDWLEGPIIACLTALRARRILDMGCGNGALARALVSAGFSVVGMDRDNDGIAIARRSVPGASFHLQSLDALPSLELTQAGPFDVAVSTEVVEHLYTPQHLLTFAATLLRPGGHVVISTPYHGYLKNLAISILDGWDKHHTALWQGGHIKFWSRRTLSQLLIANGFQPTSFAGVGRAPYLWKSMIVSARLNPALPAAPSLPPEVH